MNNDLNNNRPSNNLLLNETPEVVMDDTLQNEQSTNENKETKEVKEIIDKKERDFSLPTSLEDYLVLSQNFYAGFWTRFVAYLIDMIVIYAISSLLNTEKTLIFNVFKKIMVIYH